MVAKVRSLRLSALNPTFVDLEGLLDQGSKRSTRLYQNGTPASEGQWVGPKGSTISGPLIQLRGPLTGPSVQLEVKAP